MSQELIGRIVAIIMLVSLGLAITVETYFGGGAGYAEVNALSEQVRELGQPFLFFSIASLLGVIALIAGALLYIFGVAVSSAVLATGTALTLVSIPMVSVHVYSTAAYAAYFVSMISLGWLLARPCVSKRDDSSTTDAAN